MFKLHLCGYTHRVELSTFPGGEEFVKLPIHAMPDNTEAVITIEALLKSSTDVMRLLLINNALREYYPEAKVELYMPYMPYARQDRICSVGESFSLKVMAQLINSCEFNRVTIVDPHSLVTPALVNKVRVITQKHKILSDQSPSHNILNNADVIVAPDLGAAKNAQDVASIYMLPVLSCTKTRVSRDKIEVTLTGSVKDKNVVVLDDICDGGGTFLALAESLKEAKSSSLIVTHGIFSKGKEELLKHYDQVEAIYDWEFL